MLGASRACNCNICAVFSKHPVSKSCVHWNTDFQQWILIELKNTGKWGKTEKVREFCQSRKMGTIPRVFKCYLLWLVIVTYIWQKKGSLLPRGVQYFNNPCSVSLVKTWIWDSFYFPLDGLIGDREDWQLRILQDCWIGFHGPEIYIQLFSLQ